LFALGITLYWFSIPWECYFSLQVALFWFSIMWECFFALQVAFATIEICMDNLEATNNKLASKWTFVRD